MPADELPKGTTIPGTDQKPQGTSAFDLSRMLTLLRFYPAFTETLKLLKTGGLTDDAKNASTTLKFSGKT